MNTGLFNVFHHSTNVKIGAIEQRIDVNFDCVVKEAVNQQRVVWSNNPLVCNAIKVVANTCLVVNDLHSTSTKNE